MSGRRYIDEPEWLVAFTPDYDGEIDDWPPEIDPPWVRRPREGEVWCPASRAPFDEAGQISLRQVQSCCDDEAIDYRVVEAQAAEIDGEIVLALWGPERAHSSPSEARQMIDQYIVEEMELEPETGEPIEDDEW